MTVRELKNILERHDDDEKVVIRTSGGRYVYAPSMATKKEVTAFFGSDYDAVCIFCSDQVGAI